MSPSARRAHVWSRGALRLLPEAQVLGVPTDLDELAGSGILSDDGLARVAAGSAARPLPTDDVTIGALMRAQLGDEAAERLVDPLVGGINAGDTDQLSLAATVPQLDAAARSGAPDPRRRLPRPARRRSPTRRAPVFFAPRGGMGALVDALVARPRAPRRRRWRRGRRSAIERAAARRGTSPSTSGRRAATAQGSARALRRRRRRGGRRPGSDRRRRSCATPAPRAATLLAAIPYASVALSASPCRATRIDRELDGSGFLVPRVEGRTRHRLLVDVVEVAAPRRRRDGVAAGVGRA